MRFTRIILLFVIVLRLGAQGTAPGSIRGTVLKWGSNEPLAQAIVELRNVADTAGVPLRSTATSSNGEYTFSQVPAGRYRIVATQKGYAPGEYGRKRISGSGVPVTLAAGQAMANAQIELAPGASVSGRCLLYTSD